MTITAADLNHFTGTERYYQLASLPEYHYTEGVRYLAREADAYWLINNIFGWQFSEKIKQDSELQYFQIWILKVNKNNDAILSCYRDTDDLVLAQDIPFTDFPLPEVKLYLKDKVLLLPSEN